MSNKKVNIVPLNILIILISITGIGYYLYCYENNILAFWQYKENIINNSGNLAQYINYLKDIFVVFWGIIIIIMNYKKIKKEIYITIFIVIFGCLISLANGYSIGVGIAGIRAYIYCFVIFIFMKINYYNIGEKEYTALINIIKLSISLQVLSSLLIIFKSRFSFLPGQGGYRMIGLFTNAGTLGAFTIGATLLFSYIFIINKKMKLNRFLFWMIACIFLAFCSGSRMAIINNSILIIICLLSHVKICEKAKVVIIGIASSCFIPIFILMSVSYIDRGELMASGQGRFTPWLELFNVSNLFQIILGQGLGVGTNAAFNLGQCNFVFDSFFVTIIIQFGIIGFFIFLIYFFKLLYRVLKNNKKNKMYYFYVVIFNFIGIFSGNVLEMYVWSIPLFIVFLDIIYKKRDYVLRSQSTESTNMNF